MKRPEKELRRYVDTTFSSLKIRNFRLYFIGQAISTSGTFMQYVAQTWLVLKLTNSGTALGLLAALQYLPVLLLGSFGGVIADRFPKRKIILIAQSIMGLLALILGILVATGTVQLWMVFLMALLLGLVNTIDTPTRQSFFPEMVGESQLRNAVSLNSTMVNIARIIGPAIAGVIIATSGLAPCFILNGLSYAAVIAVLLMMDTTTLQDAPKLASAKGQLLKGLSYVKSNPVLRNTLIVLTIIGALSFEFMVSLPLIASFTFNGSAQTYSLLASSLGVGSVIGGLYFAGKKKTRPGMLSGAALLFGIAILVASFMPTLALTVLAIVVVGFFSIYYQTLTNSILQLESAPEMRGRVMSFYTVAYFGTTTIGGPIVGWIGQNIGPRAGLAFGGIAALAGAAIAYLTLKDLKFSNAKARKESS
jgi:MFS family permease